MIHLYKKTSFNPVWNVGCCDSPEATGRVILLRIPYYIILLMHFSCICTYACFFPKLVQQKGRKADVNRRSVMIMEFHGFCPARKIFGRGGRKVREFVMKNNG